MNSFSEMINELDSIQSDIRRQMEERKRRIMIVQNKIAAGEMRLTRGWKKLLEDFQQAQNAYNAQGLTNTERAEHATELLDSIDQLLNQLTIVGGKTSSRA